MPEHILAKAQAARTLDGWQVWIQGIPAVIAIVKTEREARRIVDQLRALGERIELVARLGPVGYII